MNKIFGYIWNFKVLPPTSWVPSPLWQQQNANDPQWPEWHRYHLWILPASAVSICPHPSNTPVRQVTRETNISIKFQHHGVFLIHLLLPLKKGWYPHTFVSETSLLVSELKTTTSSDARKHLTHNNTFNTQSNNLFPQLVTRYAHTHIQIARC